MKRMKNNSQVCIVIHHTENVRVTDLNVTIDDPGKLVADGNLLSALNGFLDEIRKQGYDFELIGGDDNDD